MLYVAAKAATHNPELSSDEHRGSVGSVQSLRSKDLSYMEPTSKARCRAEARLLRKAGLAGQGGLRDAKAKTLGLKT